MDKLTLKPGDVFASHSTAFKGKAIRLVERIKSRDNEASHNHTGIIISETGVSIEALYTICVTNIADYSGQKVLIARWKDMTEGGFYQGYDAVAKHVGAWYPWPRLPLHLFGLAKFIHWKTPVCSELTAKFLNAAGDRRNYWGINPDDLVDEWRISKHYDIIYEGVL